MATPISQDNWNSLGWKARSSVLDQALEQYNALRGWKFGDKVMVPPQGMDYLGRSYLGNYNSLVPAQQQALPTRARLIAPGYYDPRTPLIPGLPPD